MKNLTPKHFNGHGHEWRSLADFKPETGQLCHVRRSGGGDYGEWGVTGDGTEVFQDYSTLGDFEGLAIEYWDDVTHWAPVLTPEQIEFLRIEGILESLE